MMGWNQRMPWLIWEGIRTVKVMVGTGVEVKIMELKHQRFTARIYSSHFYAFGSFSYSPYDFICHKFNV